METLDFTLKPKLGHMALVKVGTLLWNHSGIRNYLTSETFKSYFPSKTDTDDPYFSWSFNLLELLPESNEDEDEPFKLYHRLVDKLLIGDTFEPFTIRSERMSDWKKLENIVIKNVRGLLLLSESQREKVRSCIKPIGLEILKWIENHLETEYLSIRLPREFCWTSYGTIDAKKTAVALVKDEKINITKRYKLACIYCLENDIRVLSKEIRNKHYDSIEYFDLIHTWEFILEGKTALLADVFNGNECTPFQYAFESAAQRGHQAATEYFYQKLTRAEREESMVRTTGYVVSARFGDETWEYGFAIKDHCDILRFLLSQMDNRQVLEAFQTLRSPGRILLLCCLDWPWQDLILQTAGCVRRFISRDDYKIILFQPIMKTINGFKDFNYQDLFSAFFQVMPEIHKRYFLISSRGKVTLAFPATYLIYLLGLKDKENISLILKDATFAQKEKIIFCKQGKDICVELALNNERDLLLFFVTKCLASREKLMQFSEEITSHVEREAAEDKELCMSCFQLLDNLIQNASM